MHAESKPEEEIKGTCFNGVFLQVFDINLIVVCCNKFYCLHDFYLGWLYLVLLSMKLGY